MNNFEFDFEMPNILAVSNPVALLTVGISGLSLALTCGLNAIFGDKDEVIEINENFINQMRAGTIDVSTLAKKFKGRITVSDEFVTAFMNSDDPFTENDYRMLAPMSDDIHNFIMKRAAELTQSQMMDQAQEQPDHFTVIPGGNSQPQPEPQVVQQPQNFNNMQQPVDQQQIALMMQTIMSNPVYLQMISQMMSANNVQQPQPDPHMIQQPAITMPNFVGNMMVQQPQPEPQVVQQPQPEPEVVQKTKPRKTTKSTTTKKK